MIITVLNEETHRTAILQKGHFQDLVWLMGLNLGAWK